MKKFLKIIQIFTLVFVCLVVLGLIGGFIFLKTFEIKKYKSQIVSAANKALGRDVDFKDIELKVSLKEGIRFHLTGLTVSENPEFGENTFAKVEELSVGVDLLTFLNARRISVPGILVRSPEITVIRNPAGALNVQSLGSSAKAESAAAQSAPSSGVLPAIFINSLRIEGARLNFIEQSVTPNFETAVSQLDVKIDHFSLTNPFDFAVEAAVLSPQRNLKIDGNVDLNLLSREARLSNVHIATDLGQLPLAEMSRLPMLKGVPLPSVLEGKYSGLIKECLLSEKGVSSLVLDSQLESGAVVIKDVASGILIDVSQIALTVNNFSIDKPFDFVLTAAYMSDVPNIDLKGNVAYDMTAQNVQLTDLVFNTDLAYWPMIAIKSQTAPLKNVPLPEKLSGQLNVVFDKLSAGPKGLGDLKLDARLKNGVVRMKEVAPGIRFDASKIDLSLDDFSFNGPFKVALKMAYLHSMQDIDLDGMAAYDMKTQTLSLKDFKVFLDLDHLSLYELKSSVTLIKDVPMPQALGGKLNAFFKHLEAGPQGVKSVLLDASIKDGKIEMKDAAPGVSLNVNQINMDIQDFSLAGPFNYKVQMAYLSDAPNIKSSGSLAYNMQTQEVRLKDGAVDLDLSRFDLPAIKASVTSLVTFPLPDTMSGEMRIAVNDLTAGPKGLGVLDLDLNWNDGAVTMRNFPPGISIAASQIGLELKNVSLGQPIEFRLKTAYLSDEPNVDLAGTAFVDLTQSSVQLKNTNFKTDLSLLSLDDLRSSIVSLKNAPLPETLQGMLNVIVEDLKVGAKGLVSLTTHGELTSALVKLKELAIPINVSRVKFQADGVNAKLDDIIVTLGKGKIMAKATIDQYLTKPVINNEVKIEGIDLAEVLDQKEAPIKVQGLVYAGLKVQGDPSNLNSLAGDGTFEIKEAKLKDLNVLKTVFDNIKVPLVTNLSSLVMGTLPEEYRKQFEKPDTEFKTVKWDMSVLEGMIHLEPVDVQSETFSFVGKGDVGFDQAYSVEGGFKLSKGLSGLLVQDVREPFAYLVDESDLVSFPVYVKGVGAQPPIFRVDAVLKDVAKNAIRNTVKQEAGKLLNKYFKIDAPADETSGDLLGTPAGDDHPAPEEKTSQDPVSQDASPQEQLIGGILGTIFK